eukprot:1196365-Prorocentrum_minimum.AAC.10
MLVVNLPSTVGRPLPPRRARTRSAPSQPASAASATTPTALSPQRTFPVSEARTNKCYTKSEAKSRS